MKRAGPATLISRFAPRRGLVGLAAASLLCAVVLVLPGRLLPTFVVALASSSLATPSLVLVAAGLAGLYGLRVLSGPNENTSADRPRREAVEFPCRPEVAVTGVRRVVGGDVNGAASSESGEEDWRRRRHRRRAFSQLRAAAVDAVAETTGCDRPTARRLVSEGRWTDRPRARAYLSMDDSVRPPLRTRVRDWAAGERFERAVRDAVSAVIALRDGEYEIPRSELAAVGAVDGDDADSSPDSTVDARADEPTGNPSEAVARGETRATPVAEADGGARR